jgi:hypothetical protein
MAPPFAVVSDLGPDVERHDAKARGAQCPVDLLECRAQLEKLEVDFRVEGDDGSELTLVGRQGSSRLGGTRPRDFAGGQD